MKIFNKFFKSLVATSLAATLVFAAACSPANNGNGSNSGDNGQTTNPGTTKLDTPTLTISGNTLSWNAVAHATEYKIYMNEVLEETVTTTSYSIPHTSEGTYVYKIKSVSSDSNYSASEFSNTKTFIISANGEITTPNPDAETFTVTFDSQGGSEVAAQTVAEGATVVEPTTPTKAGSQFVEWTKDAAGQQDYNFAAPVTESFTLYAQWEILPAQIKEVKSYNESLAVLFAETIPAQAKVEYQKVGNDSWIEIDNELIRLTEDDNTVCRADIVGLAAGSYNVKITTSGNSEISVPTAIKVEAYDRSGYAHFKYSDGVGAYKDDGTLKDNTIVVYVTDENKDTVMTEVCEKFNIPMFNIPTYSGTPGKDWGGKQAAGIGWWLNNSQYSTSNKGSSKNTRPSNTYDPANGNSLGFKNIDRPVVIRFIGTVTSPEGLTAYANEDQGGNVEDNGHMARMKNYKNITLEGIGEDAVIEGWGFHFMAGSDAKNGEGKSFEVRNLTFDKYPEDAIGMEGVQESGKLTGSVERCWIHHNTFLPGYCAKPTDSDKAEGDGSCDFKRGEYLTVSYNYYNDCHKTNLVGSSDDSLQYNLTYHHNWWHNCGSRMPLTRQANVHFYNNYVSLDTNVPDNINISHVHSIRANSYLFSEANYYFGSKNIADKNSGKAWNNTYLATSGTNNLIDVKNREDSISNNCKHYDGTDLSKFDTNPNLFYYDAENKVSDCLLDDSVTARYKAIQYAGCNGWTNNNPKRQNPNRSAALSELLPLQYPASAVQVPDEGKLEISGDGFKSTHSGIILNGSLSSGNFKSTKNAGQVVIFTLAASAVVTVSAPSNSSGNPYLVTENGKIIGQINGSLSAEVPAGTYIITTGIYGHEIKQTSISSIAFESAEGSAQERIQAAIAAINALPAPSDVQLTSAHRALIEAAQAAYSALTAKDKAEFDTDLTQKFNNCVSVYETLCVNNVIAKINAIGTVNANSYEAIQAAQDAFDALKSTLRGRVTNYALLEKAWEEYEMFAVQNVKDLISALVDPSTLAITDKDAIAAARAAYDSAHAAYDRLNDDQIKLVEATYVNKLMQGLAQIEQLEKLFTFKEELADFVGTTVDASNSAAANSLKTLYTSLTEAQVNALDGNEKTKYNLIAESLKLFASQAKKVTFENGQPSDTIFKHVGTKQSKKSTDFTVHAYNADFGKDADYKLSTGLKFEDGTKLELTLEAKMTLTLYFLNDNSVTISGNGVNNALTNSKVGNDEHVATITLEPGTYTIVRSKSEAALYYATLVPASI